MKSTINLLPKKSPQEEQSQRAKQRVYIVSGALFFLLLLLWIIPLFFLSNLKSREETLRKEVDEKENVLGLLSESERLYQDVFQRSSAAITLLQTKEQFLEATKDIRGIISEGLTIKNISIGKDSAKITVTTQSLPTISSYLENLEKGTAIKEFMKDTVISSVLLDRSIGYQVIVEGNLLTGK